MKLFYVWNLSTVVEEYIMVIAKSKEKAVELARKEFIKQERQCSKLEAIEVVNDTTVEWIGNIVTC
jgi:hypothetical protein